MIVFTLAWATRAQAEAPGCVVPPPQSETEQFQFIPSPAHETFAEQIPTGTRIGEIHVQRYRVFNPEDPGESNWLYRWANDFHSVTREWVIRDQLLLHEGDAYNVARVRESERLLRSLKFLFDATVRPARWCGDVVDLEVITRDIWTFWPTVSFTRSGGANDYSFGFRDTNFLGTGKQVQIRHERDVERSGNTLVYSDPAVFGSRWRFRLALTDNDDGYDLSLIHI